MEFQLIRVEEPKSSDTSCPLAFHSWVYIATRGDSFILVPEEVYRAAAFELIS